MKHYISDIESTVYDPKKKVHETEAWLLGLTDYDTCQNRLFYNINDYMEAVLGEDEINIHLHNLKGFDANFIHEYLEKHGYVYCNRGEKPSNYLKYVCMDGRSGMSFTVYTHGEKGLYIQNFFDSKKFLPDSVANIGESLGIPKGKTPLMKEGRKVHVKPEHKAYIRQDCRIILEAYRRYGVIEAFENRIYSSGNLAIQRVMSGKIDLELTRIYEFEAINKPAGYKQTYREPRYRRFQQEAQGLPLPKKYKGVFPNKQGTAHYKAIRAEIERLKKEVKKTTDTVEKASMEFDIAQLEGYALRVAYKSFSNTKNTLGRASFKGGFIHINPKIRRKMIGKQGVTLDVNSIHPYHYSTMPLPKNYLGELDSIEEFRKRCAGRERTYIAMINRVKAKVKSDRVPIIRLREDEALAYENLKIGEEVIPSEIDFATTLTQPDFEYLLDNYDIEVLDYQLAVFDYDTELMAKLKAYVDYWKNAKIEARKKGDKFGYAYAKHCMNDLFGYLGVIKQGSATTDSFVCVASFTSAYSRTYTANHINKIGFKYYCYSSVDSIHMIVPTSCLTNGKVDEKKLTKWLTNRGFKIDNDEFGAWKIDDVWTRAKFIAPNCYGKFSVKDGWNTTISGFRGQIAEKDFSVGFETTHMIATRVKGGTMLMPHKFGILGR